MPYLNIPPPLECNCQTLTDAGVEKTATHEKDCFKIRDENMARIVEHYRPEIIRLDQLNERLRTEGPQQRYLDNSEKLIDCTDDANELFHHEVITFREHWPDAISEPNGGLDFDEDAIEHKEYFPTCRLLAGTPPQGDRSSSDD